MQILQSKGTLRGAPEVSGKNALLYHQKWLSNALVMGFGDAVALASAMLIAGSIRWWLKGDPMFQQWFFALLMGWWIVAGAARLLPSWGIGVVEELRRLVTLLSLLFGGTLVVLFLTKQSTAMSRITLSVSYLLSLGLVPYVRSRVRGYLIRRDRWGVPTVVYGAAETGRQVIDALREEPGVGYVPTGFFDDDPEMWGDFVEDVPVLGSTEQSTFAAPIAILAMPGISRIRMLELLEGPLMHYKQVVIIPDLFEIPSLWVKSRNLAGILGLEITRKLLDPLAQIVKRTMDLVLVGVSAPLWGPVYLLLCLAVWQEDRGTPFFFQERVGKDGRRFKVRKFRTMVADAEEVLQKHLDRNPVMRAEWEARYKLKSDPRITRIGAFLRKYSLDEIPQILNVWRGEMSLVGPRPLPEYHLDELSHRIRQLRMCIRPGMTGLWQVSGRSDAGNEGLMRWDAFYVRNWSIWLDIVILVRTVRVVLRGTGAY